MHSTEQALREALKEVDELRLDNEAKAGQLQLLTSDPDAMPAKLAAANDELLQVAED